MSKGPAASQALGDGVQDKKYPDEFEAEKET